MAFAALLAEKSAAERRLVDATRVADDTRSDLEGRLIVIANELRAAQERVTKLELELHHANNESADHRTEAATAEAGSPVGGGGGGDDGRGTVIDKSTERSPTATKTEHAWQLRIAGKTALVEMATAEAESLRLELSQARDGEAAAVAAATEERRVAQNRVVELEGAVDRAERERESTRKRAEARLEELGRAFDEEERERGVQVKREIHVLRLDDFSTIDVEVYLGSHNTAPTKSID